MTDQPVRVAVYGRVSTRDRDQNPETQLLPLREFVRAQGWELVGEFVDQASATDLLRRTAWRDLLDQASKRRLDVVLVWRMDRAFRSVLDGANTLERLRGWGVGLRSYQEPWLDTTSPFGEAMFHITVAWAGLERGTIQERVKAGMARAKHEGKQLGRPRVTSRPAFARRWPKVHAEITAGRLSHRKAARSLGIGTATLTRLLAADARSTGDGPGDSSAVGTT
jgi:DNA invertase Pin-like site-specific DNA recombinase